MPGHARQSDEALPRHAQDRLVRMDGVVLAEDGAAGPLCMALTGVGRHLRHYLGLRRAGPNTSLVVDVSSGANDGVLSLVARTRNQSGITARSPLALNFGNEYNFAATQDVDEPDAKRFRGVLDSYFTRVATESIPCSPQSKEEEKRKVEEEKNNKDEAKGREQ